MFLRLSFLFAVCHAILDPEFLRSIRNTFGDQMAIELNRADLGNLGEGSFGGGVPPAKRRPVILIHGLRNHAGYLWRNRNAFMDNGWTGQHVLATSWGTGDKGVLEAMKEQLKCAHVKQVRNFIRAVVNYFHSEVDILAFSMGAPITRKAILGGQCVDTKEWLGEPLTQHVNTFVSVAGANHGSALCNFAFPGLCGIDTGLNCLSAFLKDINAKEGYEGRNRYYIISAGDEVIGTFNGCGEKTGSFKGGVEILKQGLNHEETMFTKTLDDQVQTLKKHL